MAIDRALFHILRRIWPFSVFFKYLFSSSPFEIVIIFLKVDILITLAKESPFIHRTA